MYSTTPYSSDCQGSATSTSRKYSREEAALSRRFIRYERRVIDPPLGYTGGPVLKSLLEKLEVIHKQLSSEKVIGVIGCSESAARLECTLTEGQVQGDRER